ncbi:MAG: hypothetical protein ACE5GZ_13420 [Gammaproteobacteria bacterium]
MVYDYYYKLSKKQQAVYRRSDGIERVRLTVPSEFKVNIVSLEQALKSEDRDAAEDVSIKIIDALVADTGAPASRTRVLTVRPSSNWGELHGLYEPEDGVQSACITVWMRTVKHKRVVAFRTFLRTLLHEFCHHLDYELFKFEDSYHTEGFFKRESSLFKQLVRD